MNGAVRRLRRFAERFAATSWAGGGNSFSITAEPKVWGEAYLADMVVTPASVIHGVLGITPTWDRLQVTPCLPTDWPRAEAEVLYRGRRHRVTIEGQKVQIEPMEQVIDLPLMWVMDFNLRNNFAGSAITFGVEFLGAYTGDIVLKKTDHGRAPSGSYQTPPYDWTMPAKLRDLTVAADLNGGRAAAVVETSNDGFQTVRSKATVAVQDGVHTYPLDRLEGHARAVRVRFELTRAKDAFQTPYQ